MSVKERYIVGVDLGGTNIVAGAMPLDGSREIVLDIVDARHVVAAEAAVAAVAVERQAERILRAA